MALTDVEIRQYQEDGLVIPGKYQIPESIMQRIDELYQQLLDDNSGNPDFSADFILGPHLDGGGRRGPGHGRLVGDDRRLPCRD